MKPLAPRKQVKVRVSLELSTQVKRYCAAHNCTEQALMRAALEQYLSGTGDRAVLMRRLDLISIGLQKQESTTQVIGEALGAFVQLWMAHNPELPNEHKAAAGRQALRRHRIFTQHVLKRVGDGDALLAAVMRSGEIEGAAV